VRARAAIKLKMAAKAGRLSAAAAARCLRPLEDLLRAGQQLEVLAAAQALLELVRAGGADGAAILAAVCAHAGVRSALREVKERAGQDVVDEITAIHERLV
jgi:hypothetical protein